eukprot:11635414-Heterocapsa_arctica.AAC.1
MSDYLVITTADFTGPAGDPSTGEGAPYLLCLPCWRRISADIHVAGNWYDGPCIGAPVNFATIAVLRRPPYR